MIQFDPDRLECPLGRMSAYGSLIFIGDRCLDDLGQFSCRFNPFLLSCLYMCFAIFFANLSSPIITDDPVQIHLIVFINDISAAVMGFR